MNIEDVRMMQAEKDHLMRYEGKHPANYNEADHARMAYAHGDPAAHGAELE